MLFIQQWTSEVNTAKATAKSLTLPVNSLLGICSHWLKKVQKVQSLHSLQNPKNAVLARAAPQDVLADPNLVHLRREEGTGDLEALLLKNFTAPG